MSHGHHTRAQGPVSPVAYPAGQQPIEGNDSGSTASFRSATPLPDLEQEPNDPPEPSDSDLELDLDMANAGVPKDLYKPPKFSGDKAETAKARTFLDHLDEYFSLFPYFALNEEDATGWMHRRAAMRLNCFPAGSHAGIWYESALRTQAFEDYPSFQDAFLEHFGTAQSDLVSLQTQWNNARQRPNDTVTQYYIHFSKLMSQLISLGHNVSEEEALGRFQYGLGAHIRDKAIEFRLGRDDMTLHLLYNHAHVLEQSHQRRNNPQFNRKQPTGKVDTPTLNASQVPKGQYCFYCKKTNHSWEECPKIAAKKANGTWKEKQKKY